MSGQVVNELHMGALGSGIASASRNALLMAVTSLYIRLAVPQLRGVQEQRGALSAGNGAGSGTRSRCCCQRLSSTWRPHEPNSSLPPRRCVGSVGYSRCMSA